MIDKMYIHKFYPPAKLDGTALFYQWVRSHLQSYFKVLNLGAGSTANRKIESLKNEVDQVYGADIDQAIFQNTDLDYAIVIEKDHMPFENNFFDLIRLRLRAYRKTNTIFK